MICKSIVMAGIMTASAGIGIAGEIIEFKPSDFELNLKTAKVEGDSVISSGYAGVFSKKVIEVKPGHGYRLLGTFIAVPDTQPTHLYVGFDPLDANKKSIPAVTSLFYPGTYTELVADTFAADTMIKVKDASKWEISGIAVAAFQAKSDGSDLPNYNITPGTVQKIEHKGNVWEITFSKPIGKSYKAGTSVREHYQSGYMYVAHRSSEEGIVNPPHWFPKFYPGTKYIRIAIVNIMLKDVKPDVVPQLRFENVAVEIK